MDREAVGEDTGVRVPVDELPSLPWRRRRVGVLVISSSLSDGGGVGAIIIADWRLL